MATKPNLNPESMRWARDIENRLRVLERQDLLTREFIRNTKVQMASSMNTVDRLKHTNMTATFSDTLAITTVGTGNSVELYTGAYLPPVWADTLNITALSIGTFSLPTASTTTAISGKMTIGFGATQAEATANATAAVSDPVESSKVLWVGQHLAPAVAGEAAYSYTMVNNVSQTVNPSQLVYVSVRLHGAKVNSNTVSLIGTVELNATFN